MSELQVLRTSTTCSFYEIGRGPGKSITRYVASTPQSRAICNDPSIVGVEFTHQLAHTCTAVLKTFRKCAPFDFEGKDFTALHYIPGSLIFGIREALYQAYEVNRHSSLFVTDLRRQTGEIVSLEKAKAEREGTISSISPEALVVFADIVITGNTFSRVFERITSELAANRKELYYFLFLNFGSTRAEELLQEFDQQCSKMFPRYRGSAIIYLEGRFTISESGDLSRSGALLAPEYVNSLYDWAGYPLERCIIYDAVKRAFSAIDHLQEVRVHWESLLKRVDRGATYEEVLSEMCPDTDPSRFRHTNLREICESQLRKLSRAAVA